MDWLPKNCYGEVAVSGVLCADEIRFFFPEGHCIDNFFQEATAEHQGKLAKEYDSAVSLPRDVNDDRDEKEINRTSKLMGGFRGWSRESRSSLFLSNFVFFKKIILSNINSIYIAAIVCD